MSDETAALILETVDPQKAPRPTELDILAPDDFFEECAPTFPPVPVEGIAVKGNPVHVAKLSAGGLDAYFKEIDGATESEYRGAILAAAIVRPNGTRIFTPSHRLQLNQFPADKAGAIIGTFFEANGLGARKK